MIKFLKRYFIIIIILILAGYSYFIEPNMLEVSRVRRLTHRKDFLFIFNTLIRLPLFKQVINFVHDNKFFAEPSRGEHVRF